jgi:hypothetical protein
LRRHRFFRRRSRCRRSFAISQRLFARIQLGLLFRDLFFVSGRLFRRKPVLHLAFDLGFSFLFSLLFLAGNKYCQSGEQRENGELLHGVVRPGCVWVIRIHQSFGDADALGAGETGIIVTFSIFSRRAFWTLA